jgi:hypothetical protein
MHLCRTIISSIPLCAILLSACSSLPGSVPPAATVVAAETFTPIPSPTSPPTTVPALMVGGDIPCYAGPGLDYGVTAILNIGVKAEVLGKDAGGEFWIIRIPAASEQCWIETRYSTILGTPEAIPTLVVEALPTKNAPRIAAPYSLAGKATCVIDQRMNKDATTNNFHVLVTLTWPNVVGEKGYRIYKNGVLLAEAPSDAESYEDWFAPVHNMPLYTYAIEAYNDFGQSAQVATEVTVKKVCKGF